MRYTMDDYIRLVEEVEHQGGQHTGDRCVDRIFPLVGENHPDHPITYCGNDSIFEVPYTGEPQGKQRLAEVSNIRVCAVDDDMGRWPRFQHVLEDDDLPA